MLFDCIDLAEQASIGGNISAWTTLHLGKADEVAVIRKRPDREQSIFDRRLAQLTASMQQTAAGIKSLAEA